MTKRKKNVTEDDERFTAAVELIGRTGAEEFEIRHSPEDDPPITWTAIGKWGKAYEVAAAMHPVEAVFRLCDQIIDGGQCNHCHKPTGFESSMDPMPLNQFVCWYQWDPELKTFRRGCE